MLSFLEEVGIVKTARREAESILLANALMHKKSIHPVNKERFFALAKANKVFLRAAPLIDAPATLVAKAKDDAAEAVKLYDFVGGEFQRVGLSFVVIKSFDSVPDMGHDLDFLVPDPSEFHKAHDLLLEKFKADPQPLTHCDKLLGKFSCFLPGFTHDFEIYPAISQLGEQHMAAGPLVKGRTTQMVDGESVWVNSGPDRVLVKVIHAMFRHNFLKLTDVVDFTRLIQNCERDDILRRVDDAGIQEAFMFFLESVGRFLSASNVENAEFDKLKAAARQRYGPDRLGLLRRDRLVLPYRIPTLAIVILFLMKGAKAAARGKWKTTLLCLATPPLMFLDFVNNVFGNRLLLRRIW
jgi:Uncharacterised nucleotidyltransferase